MTIAAFSAYLNEKFLKLSKTIGFTIFSMVFSLLIIGIVKIAIDYDIGKFAKTYHDQIQNLDFQKIVMNYLIGYLLFATALHTNMLKLKNLAKNITYLATIGVIISALITGTLLYLSTSALGINIDISYCLIFGALISPTDPVAVMSVLKKDNKIPSDIKKIILGESLFNDATGILLLTICVSVFINSKTSHNIDYYQILHILYHEVFLTVILTILFGIVFGKLFLKNIKTSSTGLLLTLFSSALVYNICQTFDFSAPLAMVIFGLISGYYLKESKTDTTRITDFWDIIDDILNSCLFVLIGLKVLTLNISFFYLMAGLIGISIIFASRYVSIIIPSLILKIPLLFKTGAFSENNKNIAIEELSNINKKSIVMTLGGIRGGISLALALSINNLPIIIVSLTYSVVILSIIVQSTLFEKYIQKTQIKW